jgi:tetratricopeptide (TPR) repeat protein
MSPKEIKSTDRELGIALAIEAQMIANASQRSEAGGKARALLEPARAEAPEDPPAALAMARALRLQGHAREAMATYESLLQSSPRYESALSESSLLAIELGDRNAALARSEQAVALNPWSSAFHERRAQVLAMDKQWTEAEREARESLRLNPFLPLPRVILIQGFLRQADEARAKEEIEIMIALNPKERTALQSWFEKQRQSNLPRR